MNTVSVIIPTYNRLPLLKKTLKTVLTQTVKPHEVIVVDDHSGDGTLAWLRDHYKGDVISCANRGKGPGAARNMGLEIASGKYIKFFDSDDLMTANTLEAQLKALENSGRGFVYSPYFYATETAEGIWQSKDSVILNYFAAGAKPLYHYMMIYGLFITIPGMLFKKDLITEVGDWREDVVSSEDWDYLFRISMKEPFPAHTNECAFVYRLHGQQTTESNFDHFQRDLQKKKVLLELYDNLIESNDLFSLYERMMYLNVLYELYKVNGRNCRDLPDLKKFDTSLHRMIWVYKRMIKKIGRLKTGSVWLPSHGPYLSEEKISDYLNRI